MIKLKIDKINNFTYHLKDYNNKEYKFNLEFLDIEETPQIDDLIIINKDLLKENKHLLSFGPLDSKYGRKIESNKDKDIIILIINNKEIPLKRLYG